MPHSTPLKIYLAGKIKANCWRHAIVDGLRHAAIDWESPPERFPVLERSIFGSHDYVGPFFASCDHGCFHGEEQHGLGVAAKWTGGHGPGCARLGGLGGDVVILLCLEAIDRCDVVFAWIEDETCHGTLVELGYARAKGKRILLAGPDWIPELWFAFELSEDLIRGPGISPAFALSRLLGMGNVDLRRMSYRDYLKTDHWQQVRGVALDAASRRCQLCNSEWRLEVHHRTYERRGAELPTDVIVLCHDCHGRFHGKIGGSLNGATSITPRWQ